MKRLVSILSLALGAVALSVGAAQAQPKYKGGAFTIEAGALVGLDGLNMNGFSVSPVGGYNFNAHWFVGGGATFNYFIIEDFGAFSLPLFARIKYTFLKSKFTPYLSCDLGYDLAGSGVDYDINPNYIPKAGDIWFHATNMGFYFRPEVGVSMRLNKRRAVHFGVGYTQKQGDVVKYKRVTDASGNAQIVEEQTKRFNLLTFRAGFTF